MYFVTPRGGTPRVAAKLRGGGSVTIVAFGSSLTRDGLFLTTIPERLTRSWPRATVRLQTIGLRAVVPTYAAHHVDRVIALKPDLVLLELSVNDALIEAPQYEREAALNAIVDRIHAALPDCDFGIVTFGHPDSQRGTATAIALHEAVAAYYNIPSFDLARVMSETLASGRATLRDGPRALTVDGLHHAPFAAQALGRPFAAALAAVIRDSPSEGPPFPVPLPAFYHGANRAAVVDIATQGPWQRAKLEGPFAPHAGYYMLADEVAIGDTGAAFRLEFSGTHLTLWLFSSGGKLAVGLNGTVQSIDVPFSDPANFIHVMIPLPENRYALDVSVVQGPVVFGDVFFVGERA